MKLIVDTNVAVVANKKHERATGECVAACARRLEEIEQQHVVVIDDNWHIIREYQNNLSSDGQSGVGDAFLSWLLTNRANPARCELVHISPGLEEDTFDEFPSDSALAGFDRRDRKFVAVCLAHEARPPILNAVDPDWWEYREPLRANGIEVQFLCLDAPFFGT